MQEVLTHVFGGIAIVIVVVSFQFDRRNIIIHLRSVHNASYSIHFLLLGAVTAAALEGFAIIRNVLFLFRTRYPILNHPAWLIGFIICFCVIGVVSWNGVTSVLSVLGLIFGTLAVWSIQTRTIRIYALLSSASWFIHNILVISYAGVIMDILMISSLTIAMFRFDRNKQIKKV